VRARHDYEHDLIGRRQRADAMHDSRVDHFPA
jgi:hypothetical protein